MKRMIVLFLLAGGVLAADELTENRALREELTRERRELQTEQERNRDNRRSIATLEGTIARVDGETPPPAQAKPEPRLLFANAFDQDFKGFWKYPDKADATIVETEGGKVLRVVSPDGKSAVIQRGLTVPEGATIRCSVKIKAENVVRLNPNAGHCGTKFGLTVRLGDKTFWPDAPAQQGSFDWKELHFDYDVPFGVKGVAPMLGLQGATGTVWFKDFKVEVLEK